MATALHIDVHGHGMCMCGHGTCMGTGCAWAWEAHGYVLCMDMTLCCAYRLVPIHAYELATQHKMTYVPLQGYLPNSRPIQYKRRPPQILRLCTAMPPIGGANRATCATPNPAWLLPGPNDISRLWQAGVTSTILDPGDISNLLWLGMILASLCGSQ